MVTRREWAHGLIARSPRPPARYGSPEFLALPDGPEKVASTVAAAESWAVEAETLVERLRVEVEALAAAHKAAEDADYIARRDAHRASWTGKGFRPDPGITADIEREWREWAGSDVT